ncbi:DNA primase [Pseudohaliea rubra]|uniref:DNA primase n=1 Tax=Pseudohaliea rubra DSM 19751 TaxID=1265313 RepID=A0A095WYY0_9GAMM|nr:DNA primase [Pseudohaliea rubra]KGE03849.1 DNA primase [Pseudohaliea rubra DSM 19751]
MAGRIPQNFLDDLLERVDIVDVVDRRVKLRKTGKNYSARCPFHDEKTPSFTVNPEKQFYYCFGCGAGGNALGFLMDYDNVDFPQAVENLAGTVGLEVPREAGTRGSSGGGSEDRHKPLFSLLEEAATFYQRALRTDPAAERAVGYLRGRGLTGEIARDFGLGFAPPGWDNLLEALGTDEARRDRLLVTGMLVRNDSGRIYDRFRDRVVFPIRDQRGRVVAFGGRVLGDDKPKYLNSPETPVFHKGRELYGLYEARQHNRKLERLLVVEGYMDVIALAQHGIRNAVATLGTATSQTHLERIFRLCPEVVFCFDGDEAGRKAAFRALEATLPAMTDGRQARFLFLSEGEDPDTLVRARGSEHLRGLTDSAAPLETFLFEACAEGIDRDTLEGRARYARAVLPHLRTLPQGVYRELMFRELAERTGLELASLMALEAPPPPRETAPAGPGKDAAEAARPTPAPRRRSPLTVRRSGHANLLQSAIALLLHQPAAARHADPTALAGLQGEEAALLHAMVTLLQRHPESSTAMLLGHWHGTPEGELLGHLAGQERLIPADGIEAQFRATIHRLLAQPERERIVARVDKLRSTDYAQMGAEQKQELRELLHQLQQLDRQSRNDRR